MKFRTKIWLLPLSAAFVFLIGVVVSYLVGAGTLSALHRLSQVDVPALQQLRETDQGLEQFRLLLQSAATEGDSDKLKDVQASVTRINAGLEKLRAIDGKASLAGELLAAFDAYQSAAIAATRAMLAKADVADPVKRMQAAQATLETALRAELKQAAATTESTMRQAVGGVERALWVTLVTGVAVLLVLGIASRFVVSSVWRDLGEEPRSLHLLTRRIAEGDLQVEAQGVEGDGRSLNAAIATMANRLRETVGTIRSASESIATASNEIASGNAELSARTDASASNLQQTASSIAQLTTSVQQSAQVAGEARRIAEDASQAAQRGGDIVGQVVANMDEISAASRKIGDIIGVIDGIAFQTNILALNAAVEAARAGEQGRGFAVVAGEVRTLAQRSATAAREIKDLIGTSTQKVDGGTRLVRDAGSAMGEIVAAVQRVNDMIGEISMAASEQSASISEVHRAADHLDNMTQQNSALVEEAGAAAASMRELAAQLMNVVHAFRLGAEHSQAAAAAPAAMQSMQWSDAPRLANA